ncbi:MAG: nuclear transport factor 2 family protein, partial [Sphingomicrobium sp.]
MLSRIALAGFQGRRPGDRAGPGLPSAHNLEILIAETGARPNNKPHLGNMPAPRPERIEMGLGAMVVALGTAAAFGGAATDAQVDDRAIVSQLDIAYQAAVKRNDADAMDKILHENYALVLGSGHVVSRAELIGSARSRDIE